MTHLELEKRIRNMSLRQFESMSSSNMMILTDDFSEDLVRAVIKRSRTNDGQKHLMRLIRSNFGVIHDNYHYPTYFRDLDFDIECGIIIGEEHSQVVGGFHDSPDDKNGTKETLMKQIKGLESRNEELEAENHQLEEANKTLIQQLEEFKSLETAVEIPWHDKVRLELLLRILEKGGTDLRKYVKARVAEVMQTITKLPISTCKNYCTNRDLNTKKHEEEILTLNSKLKAVGLNILL